MLNLKTMGVYSDDIKKARHLFDSYLGADKEHSESNRKKMRDIIIELYPLSHYHGKDYPFYTNLLKIKDKIVHKKLTDADYEGMKIIFPTLIEYLQSEDREH